MDEKIFSKFRQVLEQSLMLDHADLDFGIYRIMNQKREQILRFLNNDLHQLVEQTLNEFAGMDTADLKKQLAEKEAAIRQLGIDPAQAKPVQELREQLSQANDTEEMESHVYDHLARFLARYYDDGDFMPIRRYRSGDTYAIPYDGEEVKLYWANADQYYIKTAEYFRHYAFNTPDGKRVEFTLREATTEQNNNKEEKGKERRFRLAEEDPVQMQDDTLHIYFTYEPMPKATKQKALVEEAFKKLTSCLPNDYKCLLAPYKDGDARSLLEKHLTDYVAKNSFDYFIHKDLKGFLKRELDFYIKNEMLVIDDIDSRDNSQFNGVLAEVKAVKVIGGKIIDFLAQIENFQKRLWLKRKFVTQADYCITLDRIPRELYAEICANNRQREEWVRLFAINEIKRDLYNAGYSEPLTEAFLEANPYLVLDTALFTPDFKHRLLAAIPHIDEQCNGLLINSENFQALRLMEEKYREKVSYCYIDPPYNTNSSEILYKNGYKESSWLTLMLNRLKKADDLLKADSIVTVAIDDKELYNLGFILDSVYGTENRIAVVTVQHNPKGRNQASFFSQNVEYMLEYAKNKQQACFNDIAIDDDVRNTFNETEDGESFRWENFVRARLSRTKEHRPDNYYPLYVSPNLQKISSEFNEGYHEVWPKVTSGEFTWKNIKKTFDELNHDGYFKAVDEGGLIQIYHRYYERQVLKNLWIDKKYQSEFNGTNLLKSMFGNNTSVFSYPKSLYAVEDSIKLALNENGTVIDYFGGSGTTAHAVIDINREYTKLNYKYILVEMGSYFDTVTKPRVMKAVYSKDWNDGKPVSREGISHCFKYLRLEQYEDTLNNLELPKKTDDDGLFKGPFRTDYTLGYMLDIEAEGSLLNMQWFDHPFDVKMKITQGTETIVQTVDLVETFNYLIGLEVDTMEWPEEGLCIVQGSMRQGGRTAVVWRDKDKVTDDSLKAFLTGRKWEAKRIFLNGDTAVIAALRNSLAAKVLNTEEEFQQRMFDEKD